MIFVESSFLDFWLGSGFASGGVLEDKISDIIGKLQAFCFQLYLKGTSPFTLLGKLTLLLDQELVTGYFTSFLLKFSIT